MAKAMFNEMLRSHLYIWEGQGTGPAGSCTSMCCWNRGATESEKGGEMEKKAYCNICFDLDLFLFLLFLSIVRSFIHNNQ